MAARLHDGGQRLAHLAHMLDSLSPLGVLQRGYSIVTDTAGKVLSNPTQVKVGDRVDARLAGGRLGLIVDSVDEPPD